MYDLFDLLFHFITFSDSVWAIHFDSGYSASVFKDISYLSRAVVGLK